MEYIEIKRDNGYHAISSPVAELIHTNGQAQVVFYNIEDKGRYALNPDDFESTTFVYVLSGALRFDSSDKQCEIGPHESIMLQNITSSFLFTAIGNTKCLMFTTEETQDIDASNRFVNMIQTVEENDIYTHGHSRRVSFYATTIALALDPCYDVVTLACGADLHDIGKINVPRAILQKPGKLTPDEYNIIKQHPTDSYNILQEFNEKIAKCAYQHHERLNGSGYPLGLCGDEICMDARIVAVVDVFDALTCKRIYNEPMEPIDVIAYLKQHPQEYDQTIVDVLETKVLDGTLKEEGFGQFFTA